MAKEVAYWTVISIGTTAHGARVTIVKDTDELRAVSLEDNSLQPR